MANHTFKRTKLVLALSVLSTTMTLGVTQTQAQTNPFNGQAVPSLGQGILIDKSTTTITPKGEQSGSGHAQAPAPGATNSKDASNPDEVVGCELAEAQSNAVAHRLQMQQEASNIASKSYADMQKNAVARGCNINTKEILDLSASLPTIRGSWGSISSVVKEKVKSEMKRIQHELVERTCEVAEQVIIDATKPVRDMVDKYNDISAAITGLPQHIQDKANARVQKESQRLHDRLNGRISEAQSAIDKINQKNQERYDRFTKSIEDAAEEINFNIGDSAEAGRRQQNQILSEQIERMNANFPKQPEYRVSKTSNGIARENYSKCQTSNPRVCTSISFAEYNQINQQWQDHHREVEAHRGAINELKNAQARGPEYAKATTNNYGVTTNYGSQEANSRITFNQNPQAAPQSSPAANNAAPTPTTNNQAVGARQPALANNIVANRPAEKPANNQESAQAAPADSQPKPRNIFVEGYERAAGFLNRF